MLKNFLRSVRSKAESVVSSVENTVKAAVASVAAVATAASAQTTSLTLPASAETTLTGIINDNFGVVIGVIVVLVGASILISLIKKAKS